MFIRQIQNFLDMMIAEKGASMNTVLAYRHDLIQFFEISHANINQLSSQHILNYIQELNNFCYAQKSQARKLSALREFCKFLMQEKIIHDNPCSNISAPKQEKPLPNFLNSAQIELLISTANNLNNLSLKRIGIMIHLMFATGLRVSELISLTENSINYDKKYVTVLGKGNKERIVPISDGALKSIIHYANNERQHFVQQNTSTNWLFPSKTAKNGHITRGAFFKGLKQLAISAELNPNIISPHTLRHSFATNLINNDADLRSVQKMLGHENITTTEIYTHIIKDKLIDSVINKHPLANFHFKQD